MADPATKTDTSTGSFMQRLAGAVGARQAVTKPAIAIQTGRDTNLRVPDPPG